MFNSQVHQTFLKCVPYVVHSDIRNSLGGPFLFSVGVTLCFNLGVSTVGLRESHSEMGKTNKFYYKHQ